MVDRNDFAYRRLQPSIVLTDASIPHVIWGQDAVEYNFGALYVYDEELDLQILLSPSMIQEAVELLAPSYYPMTLDEIDAEVKAASKNDARFAFTRAFRDRPDDFTRLKLLQRDAEAGGPSHVLLIANTVFDYPLDEIVQRPFPHCPELPFPSVPAVIRLIPVHLQKWTGVGFSPQSFPFILACEMLLGGAIGFSFAKELEEAYASSDQLPTGLKDMIHSLNEREKVWVYEYFHIGQGSESSSDPDGDILPHL
ncbi:uncharacterized protein ARMOST_05028 [Armillaria ostoyae]|uniref:Uncharacterized protein n=1 Tax=Armillaria ostoyae TaxID=47428 RepID=A0A284QZ49_ARMOS|nr:uncharacterized protein ARMOST_05028 [Armillaria ostoyae]